MIGKYEEESKNDEGDSDIEICSETEREKSLEEKFKIVEISPNGRFERFNDEIGFGRVKTVYRAYDGDSGCEVAWNVIKLKYLNHAQRQRIINEVFLFKNIKHKNIIDYIDIWANEESELIVFITEIVSGGSLKSFLKKIKSPRLKIVKSWCKDILKALEYLHTQNPPIVHRDINCDNIMIHTNSNEIRLGDLGLAELADQYQVSSAPGVPLFTPYIKKGIIAFTAPEIFEEEYGPHSDIYAFGMTLLEIVVNQRPYRECTNQAQIYKKMINGEKPLILNMINDEEIKEFISDCLKPWRERPTVSDLLKHPFLCMPNEKLDNLAVALIINNLNQKLDEKKSSTVSHSSSHDYICYSKITDSNEKSCFSEAREKAIFDSSKFEIANNEENNEYLKSQTLVQRNWDWNEPDSNTDAEKSDIKKELELSKRYSEISRAAQISMISADKRWEEESQLEIAITTHKDSIFSFKNEIDNAFNLDLQKPLHIPDTPKNEQSDYNLKIIYKKDNANEIFFTFLLSSNFLTKELVFKIKKTWFNRIKKIKKEVNKIIENEEINFVKNKRELVCLLASMIQSNMDSLHVGSPITSERFSDSDELKKLSNFNINHEFLSVDLFKMIVEYYKNYIKEVYSKEYLENETEEQMAQRHNLERIEVENFQKSQRAELDLRKMMNSKISNIEAYDTNKNEEKQQSFPAPEEKPQVSDEIYTKPKPEEKNMLCTKNSSASTSEPLFSSMILSNLNSGTVSIETSPHFKPSTAETSYCDPQIQTSLFYNKSNQSTKETLAVTNENGIPTPFWGLLMNNNVDVKFNETTNPELNTQVLELNNFKLEILPDSQKDLKKFQEFKAEVLALDSNLQENKKCIFNWVNDLTPVKSKALDNAELKSEYSCSSSTSPKRCMFLTMSGTNLNCLDKNISPAAEAIKRRRQNSPGFFDKLKNHVFKGPLERAAKNMDEYEVKLLQIALNEVIIDEEVETNGRYGIFTEKLVKIFQERAGLSVTGVVTSEVWQKLKERIIMNKSKFGLKITEPVDKEKKSREELNKSIIRKKQNEASSLALSNLEIKIFQEL